MKRITRQKRILTNELDKLGSFFTAEDLHNKVKDKNIGMATVYRFLKELEEKKEFHSYLCDRKTVYSRENNNHCHFTCQNCDKIIHFDIENISFLRKKIKGEVCHFQIDVSGLCEKCAQKDS